MWSFAPAKPTLRCSTCARSAMRVPWGDGHRIVYGVASSGNTVLLIARAKLLAEDPEKRILLLCYNRLLAQHLALALVGHRCVTVATFHRWAVRCGVNFSEGTAPSASACMLDCEATRPARAVRRRTD